MCSITDTLFTEKGIEALNLGGFRSDRKTGFAHFFRRKQWVSWIESLSVAAKSFLGGDQVDHQTLFGHLFANVICQCCQAQDLHSVCNECNQLLQ